MKKLYFLLFTLLITSVSFGQITELYISMYGEGSSNNKFLEIYNGTGATVNLDNYAFPNVSNAPTVVGEYEFWNTFPSGFMLADGDVFVIAHGSADAAILAQADMTFTFLSNGDDGFALVANDGTWNDANTNGTVDAGEMTGFTILDWLGDWDADPGSGWDVAGVSAATANHTLTRKTSICGPNNDWASSAGTDASDSEWVVGASDSGWANLGAYTGCSTIPTVTITSPADFAVLPSGTTSVDIEFTTDSAPMSSQVDIIVNAVRTTDVSSPFAVATVDGGTYTVTAELIDGGVLDFETIDFSISFPCDLVLGVETAICDSETNGADFYTATIEFTGGNTSTYTIDTGGVGTVGGDDPSSMATGTISITNIPEGVNLEDVTIIGDAGNSSCNLNTTIASPLCIGTLTCPSVGDIIITEIMQNPDTPIFDSDGEYFEVYNTTGGDIDMQGWIINDSGSNTFTITASVVVLANDYAVFVRSGDVGVNGGITADYSYGSSMALGNSSDDIILTCSGVTIDQVAWDNGATFPDPTGASMELSINHLNDSDNDNGANWAEATSSYGSSGNLGTPGSANDFALSIGLNEIEGFGVYPNPVRDGVFRINSSSQTSKSIQVYDILGKLVYNKAVQNNEPINVSSLNTGLYILKVQEDGKLATRKLVVQ